VAKVVLTATGADSQISLKEHDLQKLENDGINKINGNVAQFLKYML
jgi:hypothetical protein